MLITHRHGSWVVLGTLVTGVAVDSTPRLELDCGSCTLCIEACPTGALDEPGTLDATRCLSYWTQSADPMPEAYREELGTQVYGCDICQDVCPWNRGVEKRRAREPLPSEAEPVVSLVDWLESDPDELRRRYARLYVPRNDGRYLQRNAAVALENVTRRAALAEAADHYSRMLHELLPGAEVVLTGSAACSDLVANDLDFVVLVSDVAEAAQHVRRRLAPLFELEWHADWAAFREPGPPQVDVVVTKRGTRGDAHHRRAWEVLQGDSALRAEYRRLKLDPVAYEERKAAFFERLVRTFDRR